MAISTITSAGIATDTLVAGDIAADAVGSSEIAADAVGASEIAAGAVGISELATATGIDTYYHKVPAFADDAARNTAIPSPANGMLIYNTDIGAVQQYNGNWATIAPPPNVTSVSGFLNNDTDSTLTIFGTNFTASTSVKMFTASSGGTQIGSAATTTFNSSTKLTAVFGAGSIGASGSTAYIEVDNAGATNRFATAITVNADPTVTHAGATGASANTTTHLGTYGGSIAGNDNDHIFLLHFDAADGSTTITDSNIAPVGNHTFTATGGVAIDHGITAPLTGNTNTNATLEFDASGSYLVPSNLLSDHELTNIAWTIDFWVRWTSSSNIFNRAGGGGCAMWMSGTAAGGQDRGYFVLEKTGDKPRVSLFGYNSSNSVVFQTINLDATMDMGVAPFTDDTWHHVAFVRTAATGFVRWWMDGGLIASVACTSGDHNWASSGSPKWFGTYPSELSHAHVSEFRFSDVVRYTDTTAYSSGNDAFTVNTGIYGSAAAPTIPTITFTGAATQLAADEDIEFTSVANTGKASNNQHLTDSGVGLVLTNLTGGDKNKATLTGTIASTGVTHTNMPIKAQVRKTLGDAAYANASRVVTFSGSTTTTGLAPAMPVTGTGIPASTTITTVDSSTTITLSANPTGGTLTGQSLVFSDLTRVTHINGSDTLNNADTMLTIVAS